MADRDGTPIRSSDPGRRSPASEEAKEQSAAGARGGPRAAQAPDADPGQPAQASGRRDEAHETPREVRKGFPEGRAPSEQGEGGPSAERLAARDAQQGRKGRSGNRSAHGDPRPREQRRHPEE